MNINALYFNGFGLANEHVLWQGLQTLQWHSKHDVIGFNTGVVQAIEYAMHTKQKIRRLSLISPLLFHDFKQPQSALFIDINFTNYLKHFFIKMLQNNHNLPTKTMQNQLKIFQTHPSFISTASFLKLFKTPQAKDLTFLIQKGIEIEIYLGEYDQITSAQKALDFFLPCSHRVFLIKKQGHLLGTIT